MTRPALLRTCLRCLLLASGALHILATAGFAAAPGFVVQGRLTDTNGANRQGTFGIKFSIFDQEDGGTRIWCRTYQTVPVRDGRFQVYLKDPSDSDAECNRALSEALSRENAFLEIEVVSPPETAMAPRQQIIRPPFPDTAATTISTDSVVLDADTDADGHGDISLHTAGVQRASVTSEGHVVIGADIPWIALPPELAFGSFNLDVEPSIRAYSELHFDNGLVFGGNSVRHCAGDPPLPGCDAGAQGIFFKDGDSTMGCFRVLPGGGYQLESGAKLFIQDDPSNPNRSISYFVLEGPEAGTFVRGTTQLHNGSATISLPGHFATVTSDTGPLTVQVTPTQECNGLYVESKSPSEITVKELHGGTSNAKFHYFVQGVRKGYENLPVFSQKGSQR
ncbi:hypothetical protein ACFL2T_04075 [Elusimicrobiota bacterium]